MCLVWLVFILGFDKLKGVLLFKFNWYINLLVENWGKCIKRCFNFVIFFWGEGGGWVMF